MAASGPAAAIGLEDGDIETPEVLKRAIREKRAQELADPSYGGDLARGGGTPGRSRRAAGSDRARAQDRNEGKRQLARGFRRPF